MSALKVARKPRGSNQAAAAGGNESAEVAKPAPVNMVALSAAAWEVIAKIAAKESRRDDLPDGASHRVDVMFVAKIDGQLMRYEFESQVSVGHASTRASSSLPSLPLVLAHILQQLSETHREALLRNLPAIAAGNGGELPEIADKGIVADCENLLGKLRQAKPQQVRGPVSVKYDPPRAPLKLLG